MSQALLQRIRTRLAGMATGESASLGRGAGTPAAVLVPIIAHPDTPTLLLTLRARTLADHAGQISFPGGRIDSTDATAVAAALREADEEVGLPASSVEVIGTMPEQRTGTGFRVTPVIGIVQPPLALRLAEAEVEEAFEVPLAYVLDAANHRRESATVRGVLRTYDVISYTQADRGERRIWGATAAILVNFARHVAGDELRASA